jgi:hypothetical protein
MLPRTFRRFAALAFASVISGTCSKSSPTTPTPITHAALSVTSISVSGERESSGGFVYQLVVHLRESGGVAATIDAVDLTFTTGAEVITSSHHVQIIPATANVIAAGSTADTRELITQDTNEAHAYATSVTAKVSYTDATSTPATSTGSADVPPLPEPPTPATHTLIGTITDQATRAGIAGARVEALNGVNAGRFTTTDRSGAYTLSDLLADTFRMRAAAAGYDPREQNVTVPDIPRADFELRRSGSGACAYSISPSGSVNVGFTAGRVSLAITRTSGSCGWQATTNVGWLTLSSTSGAGNATVTANYASNTTFVGRLGVITVSWNGGSAQLQVGQNPESPTFCRVVTVTVNGQNPVSVPAAGGQYTASIALEPGTYPPGICGMWSAAAPAAITFVGATSGLTPGSAMFNVQSNPSSSPRSVSITITFTAHGPVDLRINQAGTP